MQTIQVLPNSDLDRRDPSWRGFLRSMASRQWPWRGEFLIAAVDVPPAFDLAVCADESGIHDGAALCIMAGYIASVKQWLIFDERWERILKQFDVADFHSTDFFALDGKYRLWSNRERRASYADWADADRNSFITQLLEVVHDCNVHPIGAYVPTGAFWALTYGERKFLTGGKFDGRTMKWLTSGAPSRPYHLVYDHCLVEATKRTKPGLKTLFVFDQQKQFQGRAIQQFAESVIVLSRDEENLGKRFAGVLFHERFDAPGLQAADLYTHCWYRHVTDPNKVGPRYDALDRLTEKVPGMKYYSAEHMAGMFRHLPPHIYEAIKMTPEPEKCV